MFPRPVSSKISRRSRNTNVIEEQFREERRALAFRAQAILRAQMRGVLATIPLNAREMRSAKVAMAVASTAPWTRARTVATVASGFGPWQQMQHAVAQLARRDGKRMTVVSAELGGWVRHEADDGFDDGRSVTPTATSGDLPGPVDLLVVPVYAADPDGHFVGDEAGLQQVAVRVLAPAASIAIAFDFQLIPESPVTAGDMSVQWIATDVRVIEARAAGSDADVSDTPSLAAKEDRRARQHPDDGGARHSGGGRDRICVRLVSEPQANPATERGGRSAPSE